VSWWSAGQQQLLFFFFFLVGIKTTGWNCLNLISGIIAEGSELVSDCGIYGWIVKWLLWVRREKWRKLCKNELTKEYFCWGQKKPWWCQWQEPVTNRRVAPWVCFSLFPSRAGRDEPHVCLTAHCSPVYSPRGVLQSRTGHSYDRVQSAHTFCSGCRVTAQVWKWLWREASSRKTGRPMNSNARFPKGHSKRLHLYLENCMLLIPWNRVLEKLTVAQLTDVFVNLYSSLITESCKNLQTVHKRICSVALHVTSLNVTVS
jgi:hypothetical protein